MLPCMQPPLSVPAPTRDSSVLMPAFLPALKVYSVSTSFTMSSMGTQLNREGRGQGCDAEVA